MRDPAGGSPSDLDDVNDEPLLDGPELAAELPLADLIDAIPSLLPAWWRCGEDPATPNSAAIFARPRERCASLEIDTRRSDLGVGDLEAGAQELSRRRAVRVVLWDDWSAIFLKEFTNDLPWAHMDIAGTAWAEEAKPYQPKGPIGVAVRALAELPFTYKSW